MVQPLERRSVLIRYHEIALKGGNRGLFTNQLRENVRIATQGLGVHDLRKGLGLVRLDLVPGADWPAIRAALDRVFGIGNYMLTYQMPVDLDVVEERLTTLLQEDRFESFKIATERRDKTFPITSMDVDRRIGAFVQDRTGARVDIHHPERIIRIEILPGSIYVGFDKIAGPGGLPVGVGGRVLTLISGGIDSPVAAFRVIRRGVRSSLVHFHGYPFLDDRSIVKARQLADHLANYQFFSRLILVPFGEIQRRIVIDAPEAFRVILYRRMMIRIAEAIARQEQAIALVTGESLGQVASQTLENVRAIDAVAELPILRPLIGLDKQEIIDQAERLGSYDISIQPDQDCCQLFMPRHPATRARLDEVEAAEARLPVDEFIAQAVAEVSVETFRFEPAGSAADRAAVG